MFEKYYRLTGRPFQLTPDPSFFFNSKVHLKAVSYLLYGLGQAEGFILLTGEVGAGKTTLLRHLLSRLNGKQYAAATIETSQLGADDLLRMVASAFGIPPVNDKASLLSAIQRYLIANHQQGRRNLLLVDEAQNLSIPALEELRMLSNFQADGKSLMQSFLVAQPQFRATIASPDLEQLRQRVIASYHLGPMSEAETGAYVDHRLRTAGWNNDPAFEEGWVAALYRHTAGTPRRINSLMSRLLLFGCLEEAHHIDSAMIDAVANDLSSEMAEAQPPVIADGPPLRSFSEQAALAERLLVMDARSVRHDVALKRTLGLFAKIVARR
jgi:putative secretion ATPase (PEP-CTERM system associated)